MVVFVFHCFFYKDLAIYISPVTLYPIEVVLEVVFCCFICSYKNRTQEIKQTNKWLIDLYIIISSSRSRSSSRPFFGFFLKKPTCIVLAQVNVKPEVIKQILRNIHLYKKADWDQLKQSMMNVLATITVKYVCYRT